MQVAVTAIAPKREIRIPHRNCVAGLFNVFCHVTILVSGAAHQVTREANPVFFLVTTRGTAEIRLGNGQLDVLRCRVGAEVLGLDIDAFLHRLLSGSGFRFFHGGLLSCSRQYGLLCWKSFLVRNVLLPFHRRKISWNRCHLLDEWPNDDQIL